MAKRACHWHDQTHLRFPNPDYSSTRDKAALIQSITSGSESPAMRSTNRLMGRRPVVPRSGRTCNAVLTKAKKYTKPKPRKKRNRASQ